MGQEQNSDKRDYIAAITSGYSYMALSIAVQILLVPFYLRKLGRTDFGILMSLLSFVGYAAIGLGWFTGGLTRLLGEANANSDAVAISRIYSIAKTIYLAYGAVMLLAFLTVGQLLLPNLSVVSETLRGSGTSQFFFLSGVYFFLVYELSVERHVLIATKKQAQSNVVSSISLLGYILTAVPALMLGGGLLSVLVALCVGVVVARVVSEIFKRNIRNSPKWNLPTRDDLSILRRLVGPMGAGYFVFGVLGMTLQADVLLVGWLGGPSFAADFVVLYKPAEVLVQLLWRIPEYITPYVIHLDVTGKKEELAQSYRRLRRLLFGAAFCSGIGYALFGKIVVSMWVGAERAPRETSGYLLAGGCIFFLSIARLPVIYRYAMAEFRLLNSIALVDLVTKLMFVYFLKERFGYRSPIVAIVLTHVLGISLAYQLLGPKKPAEVLATPS